MSTVNDDDLKLKRRFRKAGIEAGQSGFVHVMRRHAALFYRRSDTLVVTFDNLKSRETPSPSYPWGFEFIKGEGHSHLGIVMQKRNDWFRHPMLPDFFDALKAEGFFANFREVVFFGSSMGGYGALAYSAAAPGARVFAFAPQTTLDPKLVPFEDRYPVPAARGDWTGLYLDGAESAELAREVIVCADPFEPQDMGHLNRLPTHNLTFLRSPNFGHNSARMLKNMGLISTVTRRALEGNITSQAYCAMIRAHRHKAIGVVRNMLNRAISTGHPGLALNAIDDMETSRPEWNFPRIRQHAEEEFEAGLRPPPHPVHNGVPVNN